MPRAASLPIVCAMVACAFGAGCDSEPPAPPAETTAPANLLLVTVDTLRADHLGSYGSELGVSPSLDALADRSTVFETAYTPIPFTLPAVAGLMTGRHPQAIGIRSNLGRLPADVDTLALRFRERGFATGAVVSNPVLKPRTHLDRGFDHYDARLEGREKVRDVPERAARATTRAALEMLAQLAEAPGGFFLWVHYQDPHGPYTPPERLVTPRLVEATRAGDRVLPLRTGWSGLGGIPSYQFLEPHRNAAHYRARYAAEVANVDHAVARLVDALGERGLDRETAIVFTADHGEGLGENDYWFAHGELLNEPSVRVPLLLHVPGRPPERRTQLASLLDVVPTLIALFDLGPVAKAGGVDLLAPPGAHPLERDLYLTNGARRERHREAIVSGRTKLVRSGPRMRAEAALFALPDESHDLATSRADRLDALGRRLREIRPRPAVVDPAPAPTEDEAAALRALGYVVDESESP